MAEGEKVTGSSGKSGPDEVDEVNSLDLISSLRRQRGVHKRKITVFLKKLGELESNNKLTSSFCKNQIKTIENEMSEVKKYDERINDIMEKTCIKCYR